MGAGSFPWEGVLWKDGVVVVRPVWDRMNLRWSWGQVSRLLSAELCLVHPHPLPLPPREGLSGLLVVASCVQGLSGSCGREGSQGAGPWVLEMLRSVVFGLELGDAVTLCSYKGSLRTAK